MRQKRRSYREYEDDDESIGEDLAAINDRLDNLTRQLERVATRGAERRERSGSEREDRDEQSSDRVSEALARLDRRLDQVIAEARSAPIEAQRRAMAVMPMPAPAPMPPAPPPMPMPAAPAAPDWAAEISARQRVLDGGAAARSRGGYAAAAHAMPAPIPAPMQDLSVLEHQLRQITTQIASLHQPYENALTALRNDLAEVGHALKDAMPRRAVEALEGEVRSLSERIGKTKQAGGDPAALAGLEQGLAEVRDALRNLAPAENLIGFEDAVRGLSHKIDALGAAPATPEPDVVHQLEEAIAAMRHVGSHVASDGALAQLAAEVHGLAQRLEHATQDRGGGNEALMRLEDRISALMESGRQVPPDLEHAIHSLSERLEQMQASQQMNQQMSHGDQLALQGLEDRIVKLVERLDVYDAKLNNLDSIQRGMADVLVHLEELRKANRGPRQAALALAEAAAAAEPAPAAMPAAPQLHAPAPSAPAPAPIAQRIEFDEPAPEPPPAPRNKMPPQQRGAEPRRPIDPNLPPDTPIEPGTGVPHGKPGSPAARIAASEAALGGTRSSMSEIGGKSAAIAAARHAAMAYQAEVPEDKPRRSLLSFFKRKRKEPKPPKPPKAPKPAKVAKVVDPNAPQLTTRQKVFKHLKTLIIATSVVIIILGTLQTAVDLFWTPAAPPQEAHDQQDAPSAPASRGPMPAPSAPATAPASRPMPTPDSLPPPSDPAPGPDTTNSINRRATLFDPSTVLPINPQASNTDVTGSIPKSPAPPATGDAAVNALPATFGAALRTAAADRNPGAEYEIATRYAEGRGVARNMDDAVRWLERSANAGFVPAQFRLAGVYEKGEGVKKDLKAARKLYLAAAEKGHAKAMHNLAVLYAEGIDGKPDYQIAAQWFRKASAHGIADSQFNLAILHARGIGIEQNLAESFKWFALVANKGDQDAARKRDEVAARLDPQTLMAARLAAQTFTAQPEPDEATNLQIPPGGWDRTATAAQPIKPRPRPRTPTQQ